MALWLRHIQLIVSLFLLIITELLYKYWFVKNLIPFQKYYGEDNQPFFKTLCSKPKLGLKKNVLISLGVIGVFGYNIYKYKIATIFVNGPTLNIKLRLTNRKCG